MRQDNIFDVCHAYIICTYVIYEMPTTVQCAVQYTRSIKQVLEIGSEPLPSNCIIRRTGGKKTEIGRPVVYKSLRQITIITRTELRKKNPHYCNVLNSRRRRETDGSYYYLSETYQLRRWSWVRKYVHACIMHCIVYDLNSLCFMLFGSAVGVPNEAIYYYTT